MLEFSTINFFLYFLLLHVFLSVFYHQLVLLQNVIIFYTFCLSSFVLSSFIKFFNSSWKNFWLHFRSLSTSFPVFTIISFRISNFMFCIRRICFGSDIISASTVTYHGRYIFRTYFLPSHCDFFSKSYVEDYTVYDKYFSSTSRVYFVWTIRSFFAVVASFYAHTSHFLVFFLLFCSDSCQDQPFHPSTTIVLLYLLCATGSINHCGCEVLI